MKTIIAGSRDINDMELLLEAIKKSKFKITEVVSGCCKGVDALGEEWAVDKNIPIYWIPADWEKHQRAAGPIRNQRMAKYADQAIIIRFQYSKGSINMFEEMNKLKKPIYEIVLKIAEK